MIGVNVINLEIQQGHEYHVLLTKKYMTNQSSFTRFIKKALI